MAIIINKSNEYENATEGIHKGEIVSVKVVDHETEFGTKELIQFLWLCLDQKNKSGKYVTICQRFPKSLHEKSLLAKFLKQCGIADAAGFDLERLTNATADIVVNHSTDRKGRTWVNITAVIPNTFKMLSDDERLIKKCSKPTMFGPLVDEVKLATERHKLAMKQQRVDTDEVGEVSPEDMGW
jgi:hypothetical protein